MQRPHRRVELELSGLSARDQQLLWRIIHERRSALIQASGPGNACGARGTLTSRRPATARLIQLRNAGKA